MDKKDALKQIIAEMFQKDSREIGPDFFLKVRRFEGSVGSGILDAAIRRRLGITCPEIYSVRTYAELESAVLGLPKNEASDPTPERKNEVPIKLVGDDVGSTNVSCGIDIEMVENLPLEEDYWEAEFYKMLFSGNEIAYCLAQDNPRMHFAARWCAKEALRKCKPVYFDLDMAQIEVTVDERGMPSMRIRTENGGHRLPVALSLTHTEVLAAAIVVETEGEVDDVGH